MKEDVGLTADLVDRLAAALGDATNSKQRSEVLRDAVIGFEEELNNCSLLEIRDLASDTGWGLRQRGPTFDWGLASQDYELRQDLPPTIDAFLVTMLGQILRFDFRFKSLASFTSTALQRLPEDAMVKSLSAFANNGIRHPEAEQRLRAASDLPDADWRTLHVCLHGWWLSAYLPGHSQELIRVAQRLEEMGHRNANVAFRRATALRHIAIEEMNTDFLDMAFDAMNEAFDLAGPDPDVNQDYVRERELVALTYSLIRVGNQ